MKKASFLFLVAGLAILFGLAWLYPVPSVSPFHTEDKPKRTSPAGSGEQKTNQNTETGFRAGEFVFPYYRNPSDTQPAWIFRGTSGTVSLDRTEFEVSRSRSAAASGGNSRTRSIRTTSP